jgi:phosphatidylserine/phosphatidylglycerophosphate/cardiolipin synthase-like enzyme
LKAIGTIDGGFQRGNHSIVADIDAAKDHVHLLFYIWLPDNNGLKVVEALKRAAARGRDLPGDGG